MCVWGGGGVCAGRRGHVAAGEGSRLLLLLLLHPDSAPSGACARGALSRRPRGRGAPGGGAGRTGASGRGTVFGAGRGLVFSALIAFAGERRVPEQGRAH